MHEGASRHQLILPVAFAGWRIDRALAVALPQFSRERLKALIASGQVTINDVLARDASAKVRGNEAIAVIVPLPTPSSTEAQDIPLHVLFEDDHLLVVDKPAGLVVHPAAGNFDGTLVNALLHHCRGRLSGIGGVARPGIVHRIDKDTSGLLVVAKTDPAHERLSRQFAAHSVERVYAAVVAGLPVPSVGTVTGALARSPQNRKKVAIVSAGRGKHATTHYRTVQRFTEAALVECRLETGRTHQIRVHMASIGHALLGDQTYGRASRGALKGLLAELAFHRQALHAGVLGFNHPVNGEPMHFKTPMPEDMKALLAALGQS
jgi:23S rRNA pseudouridine1911/1915/1917 synthase